MSFRYALAIFMAAQFSMTTMAHAVGYPDQTLSPMSPPETAQNHEDSYLLMQDVQVEKFDDAEDESNFSFEDQSFEEATRQHIQDFDLHQNDVLADSDRGAEANSTVILPAGTRFFVRDGFIDSEGGERFIQVQLESGYRFWTKLSAFDNAAYINDGDVAKKGKSAAGKLTSKAGWRVHPISGKLKCHEGTDISYPEGTPIGARVGNGKVTFAGTGKPYRGYGKVVVLEHPNNKMSLYAHLSKIAVTVGQEITTGQRIGNSGCTGTCTGPHLHYEHKTIGTSMCGSKKRKKR